MDTLRSMQLFIPMVVAGVPVFFRSASIAGAADGSGLKNDMHPGRDGQPCHFPFFRLNLPFRHDQ